MYSSTFHHSSINNNNPFPNNFPSSSSPSYPNNNNINSYFLIDNPQINNDFPNNTTLLDHHDPLLSVPNFSPSLFPHETTHFPDSNTTNNNNNSTINSSMFEFEDNFVGVPNFVVSQQQQQKIVPIPSSSTTIIGKKDRHSKIHTSQGLRDRRVRLSSEIARKFFDLQDMLEFDKPSNTLEWLFSKSESAIKELAASTKNNNTCTGFCTLRSAPNNCSCNNNNNNNKTFSGVGGGDTGGGAGGCSKGRNKLKWTQREETKKELRERARARARERTCYKMCNSGRLMQQQQQEQDNYYHNHNYNYNHNQQLLLEEIMKCPATTSSSSSPIDFSTETEAYARWRQNYHQLLLDGEMIMPRDNHGFNVIEESIMIKRNMLSSSSSSSQYLQQQNLASTTTTTIPKELVPSFNNNNNMNDYPLFSYSTPNWETSSNFCGIATMNLSTCFMNQSG